MKRLLLEAVGMLMDAIGNLNLYIHNRRTGNHLKYARIITGSYRKFAALLLVSMIPTALLGISSRRLAVVAGASPICQGIGFLISGIILLVTDLSNSGAEGGPREASWDSAMWDRNLSGAFCISRDFQAGADCMCSSAVRIQP